jgi:hypothetical protein
MGTMFYLHASGGVCVSAARNLVLMWSHPGRKPEIDAGETEA